MDLREVQSRLAAMRLYEGKVDGLYGKLTSQAIDALFLSKPYVKVNHKKWSAERRTLAAGQLFCMIDGIDVGDIDGLMGPQTRHAFEVYAARKIGRGVEAETWRDSESPPPIGHNIKATVWPRQADCVRFFGPVGSNQTSLTVPAGFGMVLAWDTSKSVSRFSCHEKIHDPAKRVLERVLDHYKPAGIKALGLHLFGGCLNVRKMRGGSAWSMHSWGIAIDFDPERNQLKWTKQRAHLALPDANKFWDLWEAEGFLSLGRARDFDWMHVQAARL